MATPLPLRSDYHGLALRALVRTSKDVDQTRRLLALASIYDGGSRQSVAKLGGVGLQIVRDWGPRFNADGSEGLIDPGSASCQPARVIPPKMAMPLRKSLPRWHPVRTHCS